MEEELLIEEMDRYLDGQMSEEERKDFEALCSRDAEIKDIFEKHKAIREHFHFYEDRKKLEHSLGEAYRDWKAENNSESKVRPVRMYLWKTAAIAAAVTLLIATGSFWLGMNQYNKHKTHSYTILRREIDNIKRSQNNLLNNIHSSAPANPGQYGGTGFAISPDGYLATNAHVVKDADSIYVVTHEGKSFKANIVYEDKRYDLAILKIGDSAFHLSTLPFILKNNQARLGEEVYTLGYPRDEIVYGKGYISAETGYRGDSNSYQIAIPVNPGNSGGPLIDSKGQILGIISGKQSASDDIAFAVKSSFLLNMLDSLPQNDFNTKTLEKKTSSLQHLNRVDQIKKLQPYIFLIRVYNE